MGWRGTGKFAEPREIQEEICDVCGEVMGGDYDSPEDKYPQFELQVHHKKYEYEGDTTFYQSICSVECADKVLTKYSVKPSKIK